MHSLYKNNDLLKNHPFYSSEIESNKKKNKKISNIELLSELPFFHKKPKELTNKELSEALPFPPKRKKRTKRLTKYQVLRNILPFFDTVRTEKRKAACRIYAETYNVEVTDNRSLNESLFLAK